eukprot:2460865-Pleurochrysis_carterae.AAC.1
MWRVRVAVEDDAHHMQLHGFLQLLHSEFKSTRGTPQPNDSAPRDKERLSCVVDASRYKHSIVSA